ncbi:hypothetical protein J1605_012921 [Eschrichtius robustus]|uniref:Ras-related protein Rab-22A n=1 Tax=Eschrichtius robustus TaxID=9764 RepID=A0AB34GKR9_ESCRO|nr:hypothetical protein J1605_012921 [Eschrichtius robustus]
MGTRGTVPATEAGPARLVTDGPGRGPANGRPPPLRAPRPGLGRAAAALGDARAGPGLSLLNLGRRRARAPGSQAMALRELKVCLLGDTGVGKSSIVWRFVEDSFDPNINPTIGTNPTHTCALEPCLHQVSPSFPSPAFLSEPADTLPEDRAVPQACRANWGLRKEDFLLPQLLLLSPCCLHPTPPSH